MPHQPCSCDDAAGGGDFDVVLRGVQLVHTDFIHHLASRGKIALSSLLLVNQHHMYASNR